METFDYIHCHLPGVPDLSYHTNDTPEQFIGHYRIDEKGLFWHEEFDIPNLNEIGKWRKDHPGEPFPEEIRKKLPFLMEEISKTKKIWVQIPFTGNIEMSCDDVKLIASIVHGICLEVFRIGDPSSSNGLARIFPVGPPAKRQDEAKLSSEDDSHTWRIHPALHPIPQEQPSNDSQDPCIGNIPGFPDYTDSWHKSPPSSELPQD